jgi:hypothetical protein
MMLVDKLMDGKLSERELFTPEESQPPVAQAAATRTSRDKAQHIRPDSC